MELGLTEKVAVVAGASRGLGRAVALGLAAEGMRLGLTARNEGRLGDVASAARAAGAADVIIVPANLTSAGAAESVVAAVVRRYGTIDRLVNVVGGPEYESAATGFLDFDYAAWQRAFDSVVMTTVQMCRAVIPIMQLQGGGAIVNVAGAAVRQHIPSMGQHESQKAAVAHITKSLAREFAPMIRVNAVLPGMILDERNRGLLEAAMVEQGRTEAEVIASMTSTYYELTWSQRAGRPEEIADGITFLLSDRAGYINGSWLNIDGGTSPG